MAEIRDVRGKQQALDSRTHRVEEIQAQVARLERAMAEDDERGAPRGWGCFGWLLRRRRRGPSAATGASLEQAVFGHKAATATASASATDRLSTAARSMEAHAEGLGERARAARARAKALMGAGKKPEAMAMLKKAKHAEAQYENALATHSALERQIDVLAESALQREVATALSASVSVAKKKTLGLLSKTEAAVDSAVELKDFAEDVSQAFGGLQTDNYDDDELLQELQEMSMEEEVEEVIATPAPAQVATPAMIVDVSAYPTAPRAERKLERKSLLSDDSAAHEASEAMSCG
tara:strand:- start:607 stop:1488 length:882 start_codon:yes stop_codon:yes gene_type:complete